MNYLINIAHTNNKQFLEFMPYSLLILFGPDMEAEFRSLNYDINKIDPDKSKIGVIGNGYDFLTREVIENSECLAPGKIDQNTLIISFVHGLPKIVNNQTTFFFSNEITMNDIIEIIYAKNGNNKISTILFACHGGLAVKNDLVINDKRIRLFFARSSAKYRTFGDANVRIISMLINSIYQGSSIEKALAKILKIDPEKYQGYINGKKLSFGLPHKLTEKAIEDIPESILDNSSKKIIKQNLKDAKKESISFDKIIDAASKILSTVTNQAFVDYMEDLMIKKMSIDEIFKFLEKDLKFFLKRLT